MCSPNFSSWGSMRYCFDIDGTLCYTPNNEKGKPDYLNAKPFSFMVQQVNRLYDEGDRKSTRLNSSHVSESRMPSSA